MGALWDSHYDGIKQLIDINPVKITWCSYPLKDNGRDVPVPDKSAEPEHKTAWVRISHQRSGVQDVSAAATGFTTHLSMYLLALYDVDLREGDIITAEIGTIQRWKVGVVNELFVEGECYAKQAPLMRAGGEAVASTDQFVIYPMYETNNFKFIVKKTIDEVIHPWKETA